MNSFSLSSVFPPSIAMDLDSIWLMFVSNRVLDDTKFGFHQVILIISHGNVFRNLNESCISI